MSFKVFQVFMYLLSHHSDSLHHQSTPLHHHTSLASSESLSGSFHVTYVPFTHPDSSNFNMAILNRNNIAYRTPENLIKSFELASPENHTAFGIRNRLRTDALKQLKWVLRIIQEVEGVKEVWAQTCSPYALNKAQHSCQSPEAGLRVRSNVDSCGP